LNIEEIFWQEKSKIKWHCEGDRNTAYFYRIAKIRASSSLITTMRDGDNLLIDPNIVSAHTVNDFQNLFTADSNVTQNSLVEDVIPNLITDRGNNMLTILPSMDEIYNVVFSLSKDSAPGPDGFGAFFFQTYWSIVKHDVSRAVLQFFTSGWLLLNFNANLLVLIPKTNHADSVHQYRPIALENFKFKIISKILADRLASVMPAITSVQ